MGAVQLSLDRGPRTAAVPSWREDILDADRDGPLHHSDELAQQLAHIVQLGQHLGDTRRGRGDARGWGGGAAQGEPVPEFARLMIPFLPVFSPGTYRTAGTALPAGD